MKQYPAHLVVRFLQITGKSFKVGNSMAEKVITGHGRVVGKTGDVDGEREQEDLPPQRDVGCDIANTLIETSGNSVFPETQFAH